MIERCLDPVVSLRLAEGSEVRVPLRELRARQVIGAVPWRKARSARGQAHYPGYYWSVTMGSHVIYESRLELARLPPSTTPAAAGCAAWRKPSSTPPNGAAAGSS